MASSVAFAAARWSLARDVALPVAIASSAVPIIAFAPIINNWFGVLNPLSKMVMAALLVFFPVMINVTRGLTEVKPSSLELMRSYAATDVAVLRKVRIPNMLPFFFTALKVGTTLSFIGAIVGEYFGGTSEVLGQFVLTSMSSGAFDQAWAGDYHRRVGRDSGLPGGLASGTRRDPLAFVAGGRLAHANIVENSPAAVRSCAIVPPGLSERQPGRSRRRIGTATTCGLEEDLSMRDLKKSLALLVGAVLVAACQAAAPTQAPLTAVELQLQWEPQAQFAGYFAADKEGYYAAEGLDVEILRGGAEIIPQVVGSEPTGPEFTISWVPKVLEVRANGQSDLVNIAQIFQRSGTRSRLVGRIGHRVAGRLCRQECRRLGLRQRVRGDCGRPEGGPRRERALHQGHPAVQHGPVAQP